MIGKLSGKIDSIYEDHIILNVAGVGYILYCSAKTLGKLRAGDSFEPSVETCVREDSINLYGFFTSEEKFFFNLLRSVSGIGNKTALAVLSRMEPLSIGTAIESGDEDSFKSVPGLGSKTAKRILVELKDKAPYSLSGFPQKGLKPQSSMEGDAVKALVGLGIGKIEAYNKVASAISEKPDLSLEDLIKAALRN